MMRNFNFDQFDVRTVSIVAAAGVAGLALIGIGSRLLGGGNRFLEDPPQYFYEDVKRKVQSNCDVSTRPSSVTPLESPTSIISPISYSKSAVPKSEGDLLFFKILESYSSTAGGGVLRETPELSSTSGSSTPALPVGQGGSGGQGGKKKRRSKNKSKNIVNNN